MKVKTKLVEAVKKAASGKNGRQKIACRKLFQVAESQDAKLSVLGKICDLEGIRIVRCQLGCFE